MNTNFPFFLTHNPRKTILWVQVGLFRDTTTVTEKIHHLCYFITGYKPLSVSPVSSACAFSFICYMPSDSNEHHSTKLLSLTAQRGWEGRTESRLPIRLGFVPWHLSKGRNSKKAQC